MKKSEAGFSLIEMLIVATLSAVVALAIYGLFDSGIRVMRKATQPASGEALVIFFERLSRDLQNSFHYKTIPFQGSPETLALATVIQTEEVLGGNQGIGRIKYFYDNARHRIGRQQENVSDLYEEEPGRIATALDHASALSFSYYGRDKVTKEYKWEESWDETQGKENLPLAVKVKLTYDEEGQTRSLTRTIAIPVGA